LKDGSPRAKARWRAEFGQEVLNERSEFRNLTPIPLLGSK